MNDSPLRRLPPELRVLIYEFTLSSGTGKPLILAGQLEGFASHPTPDNQYVEARQWPPNLNPTAISMTCKEIHRECARIFFSINTFTFDSSTDCCYQTSERQMRYSKGLVNAVIETFGAENAKAMGAIEFDLFDLFWYTCGFKSSPPLEFTRILLHIQRLLAMLGVPASRAVAVLEPWKGRPVYSAYHRTWRIRLDHIAADSSRIAEQLQELAVTKPMVRGGSISMSSYSGPAVEGVLRDLGRASKEFAASDQSGVAGAMGTSSTVVIDLTTPAVIDLTDD